MCAEIGEGSRQTNGSVGGRGRGRALSPRRRGQSGAVISIFLVRPCSRCSPLSCSQVFVPAPPSSLCGNAWLVCPRSGQRSSLSVEVDGAPPLPSGWPAHLPCHCGGRRTSLAIVVAGAPPCHQGGGRTPFSLGVADTPPLSSGWLWGRRRTSFALRVDGGGKASGRRGS